MARGVVWTDVELSHLARGWSYATEDRIAGIHRTVGRFRQTMIEKYESFARSSGVVPLYGAKSGSQFGSSLTKYLQAFRGIGVFYFFFVQRNQLP